MDKYHAWLSAFDHRDGLTAAVFAITALVLALRQLSPGWARRFYDLILGGLYGVAFVLVMAFI